jgi:hypothetical protein
MKHWMSAQVSVMPGNHQMIGIGRIVREFICDFA